MLSKEMKTKILGRTCIKFSEINSTQKYIHNQIKENKIQNGTVVIADVQTDAIGTHGRKWYTSTNNIAFSLYMEINQNVKKLEGLTYKIAEILVQIFQEKYNISLFPFLLTVNLVLEIKILSSFLSPYLIFNISASNLLQNSVII